MKILIALNHPAHYYLFKFTIEGLKKKYHEVAIVIKEKDVLEKILISEKQEYYKISFRRKRKKNILSILFNGVLELIIQDLNLFRFVNKFKPDVLLGTDISIAHVGKIKNIPSFIFNEDDFESNKLFSKVTYPFASYIVSPSCTSVGKFSAKKIAYDGIQKIAYLHPKYFQPDFNIIKNLGIKMGQMFFIIRLVSLTSGHDIEGKHTGIDRNLLRKLISKLEPKGKVFITSEENLEDEFEQYQLDIKPNQMHDVMSYATLFIGDSQSMCAEAGILGTPFIRFNDFVGKLQYLNELENKYELGWGVKTETPEKIFTIIDQLMEIRQIKEKWQRKRNDLLGDKIDLNSFIIWLIENYPESVKKLKENPEFQSQFK